MEDPLRGFFAGRSGSGRRSDLIVLYSIVPWIGVMAAGYAFGKVLTLEPGAARPDLSRARSRRHRAVLRAARVQPLRRSAPVDAAGPSGGRHAGPVRVPQHDEVPGVARLPADDPRPDDRADPAPRARAWRARPRWLAVFGRVPFFFYVLHIPLIHALALVVSWIRLGTVSPWLFANHPMGNPPPPDGYTWSLPVLYAVWVVAIALLYVAVPLVRRSQGPPRGLVAELPLRP